MLRRLIKFLFPPVAAPAVTALYRSCIAQARLPIFYTDLQVPDSVEGRFDMLILHILLIMRRLKECANETQQLFDILFADMDRNLREMGIGDMGVPKRMKALMEIFYGRAQAYNESLDQNGEGWAEVIQRNIYGHPDANAERLADYARRLHESLKTQKMEDILMGKLEFPVVIV